MRRELSVYRRTKRVLHDLITTFLQEVLSMLSVQFHSIIFISQKVACITLPPTMSFVYLHPVETLHHHLKSSAPIFFPICSHTKPYCVLLSFIYPLIALSTPVSFNTIITQASMQTKYKQPHILCVNYSLSFLFITNLICPGIISYHFSPYLKCVLYHMASYTVLNK